MSAPLSDIGRAAGKEALLTTYRAHYDDGDARSEDMEDATMLHMTLGKAKNIDHLIGIKTGILSTFTAFFPDLQERRAVVESSIDSYIAAACKAMGVKAPDLGRSVAG